MQSNQDLYNQLAYYTLSHSDKAFFIHQFVVDAFAAQTAQKDDKPIKIAFALAGLYLANEKNYTGREVQLSHMALARNKKPWPSFELPKDRGKMTIDDVLAVEPGPKRDQAIKDWSASVWEAFQGSRYKVVEWLNSELDI
jgi:hypothetical protein